MFSLGTAIRTAGDGNPERGRWLSEPFSCLTERSEGGFEWNQNRPGCVDEVTEPVEGRPLDEQELIKRSQDGDLDAFGQLVRIHQGLALRVAYLVVRDHAEAEDVTQEAFVRAFGALPRFDATRELRPWLLRIVRNRAITHLRGRTRRRALDLRLEAAALGDATPSPETAVQIRAEYEMAIAALNRLPGRQRVVLEHRFLLDLSEAETSQILGLPKGTVKSRTSRGLASIRALLAEENADG